MNLIIDWFNNLLKSSTLSDVELFGLNGWWLLLIGSGFWIVIMTILAIVSHVRSNRALAAGDINRANRARARRSLFVSLAIFIPIVALCLFGWPKFWAIPIVALVVGLALLIALFFKAIKWMVLIAIGLVVALLLTMIVVLFGGNPFANDLCEDDQGKTVSPYSYALDVDENGDGQPDGKFGPAMPTERQAFIDEMTVRSCKDKALLAAANVSKEGTGDVGEINQVQAQYGVSRAEWSEGVSELVQFMEESEYSVEFVPAGTPSLYMALLPNGEIEVRHGSTVEDGHVAVFRHPDGRILRLRIECGAQPTFFGTPTGIPACTGEDCPVPVCPTNPALPPDSPDCLQSKDPALDVDEDGWNVQPVGPKTTGNESEAQQESGEVDGNVIDDQVSSDTQSDDTTSDTTTGTVTVIGGAAGGDDVSDDVSDGNSAQDDDGTTGATVIVTPAD